MPPHLFVKAAFIRGELEEIEKRKRAEYILQNIYSYLLKDRYYFPVIRALNEEEKNAFESLKEAVNSFRISFSFSVESLCSERGEITDDTLGSVLLGVSYELFSQDITWGRIVTFIVFIGEFVIMCLNRNLPKYFVEVTYDIFSRFAKETLQQWISDHGGWSEVTEIQSVGITKFKASPLCGG